MPYITEDKRQALNPAIDQLREALVKLATDDESNNFEGNVNYSITRLLHSCYGTSYRDINDVMGVLSCIQAEYYRKKAAPYEDQKEFENGEVEVESKPILLTEVVIENDQ